MSAYVRGRRQSASGLVPHPVEPDAADRAVVRQQLGELRVHEVEISRPVARLRAPGRMAGATKRRVVGVVPVELRVIEEQLDALPRTLGGERLQRIAGVGRPVDDVVPGRLCREHREAVVMARRDRDVLRTGGLRDGDPFARVELHRVERRRQPFVRVDGHVRVLHHPLAFAELAVDAPVDEHPELRVAKPFARGGTFGRNGVWRLTRRARDGNRETRDGDSYTTHGSTGGEGLRQSTRARPLRRRQMDSDD